MKRLVLVAVLALAVAGEAGAGRTVEKPEGAYEVVLRNLVLPTSAFGVLSVRRNCTGCLPISLRVNASTEYSFDGAPPQTLADFQIALSQLRQRAQGNDSGGVVFYNPATKRVTRVVIQPAS